MHITDRKIVLSLNSGFQAIGVKTVADAFVAMMGGNENNPPVKALDIIYSQDDEGNYKFDEMPLINPVSWIEWLSLPIREHDLVINTAKTKIRVPTVVVSVNYHKIPKRKIKPTARVLYELQNGICGYTGDKISLKQGSVEHVVPRSHGGSNTFENLIYVKKEINHERGNKPLETLGLKPKFKHKTPAPIPVNYVIKSLHPDWRWFLGE